MCQQLPVLAAALPQLHLVLLLLLLSQHQAALEGSLGV
jgi:hypothetical protein